MATLQIDLSGSKGLSYNIAQDVNRSAADINLRYDVAKGQMVDGIYNPLIRRGYLYPATNSPLTMDVPTIADEFFCSYSAPNTGVLFSGQDDHIYGSDDTFTVVSTIFTYEKLDPVKMESKVDTGENVYDIELYQLNGAARLFYIANNDVGLMTTSFGSNDNDYLSTVATGGAALHSTGNVAFLRKADNGFLYVFDDYAVHKIDGGPTGGSTGIASMDVLLFPAGVYTIYDAVDTRGRMYIAIGENSTNHIDADERNIDRNYNNNCGVYVWDRRTSVASMQDFITVESCMRINRIWVGPDGAIYMMTTGTNTRTQIRKFDGSKFTIIFELPAEAKISVKDGLIVAERMTFWAGDDGIIYMMGDVGAGFSVFKIATYTSTAQATAGGAVLAYAGSNSFTAASGYRETRPSILVGYRPSGTNAVIKKFYLYGTGTLVDDNGNDGSGFITPNPFPFYPSQGDVYTGVELLPTLSTLKNVEIRCAPTGTGSTVIGTVKYYLNQSTTPFMTKNITMDQASRGYVMHEINKSYVNTVQMEIEWATGTTMGADSFSPYLAIINYETTTTRKGD